MAEIESADAGQIVDSSSEELLRELTEKHRKWRAWPWVAVLFAWATFVSSGGARKTWVPVLLAVVGVVCAVVVAKWDKRRKSTVLNYEIDPDRESAVQGLREAICSVGECGALWHVQAEGANHDLKRNAGASSSVRRATTSLAIRPPPYVATNVDVPCLSAGRQSLYFFPDRLLIYEPRGIGAISYASLQVTQAPVRFVEAGSVPRDAQVVGQTWQYVNKSGGPDRRFNNNRQFPICLYEEINFASDSGLNERIQVSRQGIGKRIADAVRRIGTSV